MKHQLKCDGPGLAYGVKQERPWSCACGWKTFGYDVHVKRAFREHKKDEKAKGEK